MDLLNYETPGSERAQINTIDSQVPVIINEDWAMVCKIETIGTQASLDVPVVLTCTSIWDEGLPLRTFNVLLLSHGSVVYPPASSVSVGQYIAIFRVGEFNSPGIAGFELHTENSLKASWITFAEQQQMIAIRDQGSGYGIAVIWQNGAWQTQGAEKALLPMSTTMYGSPWQSGNIYLGIDLGTQFLVEVRGYGIKTKTFSKLLGTLQLCLDVDFQGNLLDFRIVE